MQVRISIVRESKPSPAPASGRSRWRRPAGLAAVMAVIATALVASAGAAPTTDTTAVAFVPITPKQMWNANSIPAGNAESVLVIGGTTTVPTNATTVQLSVTAKGAAAGQIELFPAGNRFGAASNHTLSWTPGGTNSAVTAENVGLQNKVTVLNHSTKAAAVTVKILGYSTQVTAGDINGSGGTNGQVLTNNGAGGATWKSPRNDGFGASGGANFNAATTVATVVVPAGNYMVQFSGEFENWSGVVNTAACDLLSPANLAMARTRATIAAGNFQSASVALVGIGKTSGGSFKVQCRSVQGQSGYLHDARLVAVQVDNIGGTFTSSKQAPSRR